MVDLLLNSFRLLHRVAQIQSTLTQVQSALTQVQSTLTRMEAKMSAQTDAWAALAAVEQKLEADELLDEQKITSLTAERDTLKTQLANAPADDTAQINDLKTKLQALDDQIVAEQAAAAGTTNPPPDQTPPSDQTPPTT